MSRISTNELENRIKDGYTKLKPNAEKDGIYFDLDVLFSNKLPIVFEGMYTYSDKKGYHYAGVERGIVKGHRITDDLFEISYWIYKDATFKMSTEYEYRHRNSSQDPRRIYFEKQLELLGLIGEEYRRRGEIEINKILKDNPYNDNVFNKFNI